MTTEIHLRSVRNDDLPTLLALNEAEIPHVNSVPLGLFEQFAAEACYFGVATAEDRPVGVQDTEGGAKTVQLLAKPLP